MIFSKKQTKTYEDSIWFVPGVVGALVCWTGECGGDKDWPVCPDADADMRLVTMSLKVVAPPHNEESFLFEKLTYIGGQ